MANVNVVQGSPVTLNRPVILTDSASLQNSGSPNVNYVCGLTADALMAVNTEEETIVSEIVTGLENLVVRLQGEYAYNVGLKGYKWDVSNGGANPTDANVGVGTNWDLVAADHKDTAGFVIQTRSA